MLASVITSMGIGGKGPYTHIYFPVLDITLVFKITIRDCKTCIKLDNYRRGTLGNTNSSYAIP
jgi:hypothetical protein